MNPNSERISPNFFWEIFCFSIPKANCSRVINFSSKRISPNRLFFSDPNENSLLKTGGEPPRFSRGAIRKKPALPPGEPMAP